MAHDPFCLQCGNVVSNALVSYPCKAARSQYTAAHLLQGWVWAQSREVEVVQGQSRSVGRRARSSGAACRFLLPQLQGLTFLLLLTVCLCQQRFRLGPDSLQDLIHSSSLFLSSKSRAFGFGFASAFKAQGTRAIAWLHLCRVDRVDLHSMITLQLRPPTRGSGPSTRAALCFTEAQTTCC